MFQKENPHLFWKNLTPLVFLQLKESFSSLLSIYQNGFTLSHCLSAAHELQGLLLHLLPRENGFTKTSQGKSNKPIEKLIALMNERITGDLSLTQMAQHTGLSVTHLSRLFRQSTDFSPTDYFLRLKIKKTSEDLLNKNDSIRSIAFEAGWKDEYYFSRLFKKITGESPKAYRKHHKI
jgi:YesN/AraC family two-component response regulator